MTGEMLATQLKISLATIRADLRLLTTVGILDARPKVGYAYQGASVLSVDNDALFNTPIAKILLPPTEIKLTTSMEEAVTKLFLADVGSLYVLDDDGALVGLISRKDLLRASFTDRDTTIPASIVMTRMPNVVTVTADTTIMAASKLLLKHNVDSLPVIQKHGDTHVIGKITKNRIFKYLIETLFTFLADRFRVVEGVGYINHTSPRFQMDFCVLYGVIKLNFSRIRPISKCKRLHFRRLNNTLYSEHI